MYYKKHTEAAIIDRGSASWLNSIACEQALLFGQAKRASRERVSEGPKKGEALLSSAPRGFAARSRVLARPVLLAQTGELASRLE